MAKKTTKQQNIKIVTFPIDVRSVDRSRKDLQTWRDALLAATSIHKPTRKILYDLYEDIMLDDHLSTVIAKRILAITVPTLTFQRGGKQIDSIQELIDDEMFEQFLEEVMNARFYGYSLVKADFRNRATELVPRANVQPHKKIVTRTPYDEVGIAYNIPPYDSLYLAAGRTNDLGLIYKATPLVLLKRGDISDWALFNEIFGQPLRKATYDPNMPGQKEQLTQAMEEAAAAAYTVIPDGANVDYVEANKTGATDTYDTFAERMERGISKLILGQTMTTEDGSSRSQAEVHERVEGKIAAADRKWILRYLNGAVRGMLLAQGFTDASSGDFQFMDEEENVPKEKRLQMDLSIHNGVGPLKKKYFQEEYNVEFIDDSDESKQEEPEPDPAAKPHKDKKKVNLSVPDSFFD